ncbi:hypothetical protein KOI35_37205 [Actinoplanes bogorensis]|uniref:Uncharacterized protein n=1 Tax=Paractinoplanes bogorensis TaxID=1610840 RepID=A0ABS5Z0J0_9ACTN|nr:hypothetical protein [Actinoplanes bogorensis]MBU2669167.1 hypothetical protein [Actinoplanes bogorensis]
MGRAAALLGETPGTAADRLVTLLDGPLPAGLSAFRRGRWTGPGSTRVTPPGSPSG